MKQNCSGDWEKLLNFGVSMLRILQNSCKTFENFEITRTIYSKSERSVQFLKQNAILIYFWKFLRSTKDLVSHSWFEWTWITAHIGFCSGPAKTGKRIKIEFWKIAHNINIVQNGATHYEWYDLMWIKCYIRGIRIQMKKK